MKTTNLNTEQLNAAIALLERAVAVLPRVAADSTAGRELVRDALGTLRSELRRGAVVPHVEEPAGPVGGSWPSETNPDREMRLGILEAARAFRLTVGAISLPDEAKRQDAELTAACLAFDRALLDVLLAHPANRASVLGGGR